MVEPVGAGEPGTAQESVSVTAPELIVERLRGMIHRGELGPGDRLPAERELTERFGVARVTVRRGLSRLQHEGYLAPRRGAGGGTFVTELVEPRRRWLTAMRDNVGELQDILDFRVAVEERTARLAAARRTDGDLHALDRAIASLDDVTDVVAFRAADNEFHQALAAAARSPRLVRAVDDARGELFLPVDSLVYPPDIGRSVADHRSITSAIRRQDADAAATAMTAHIEATRQWLTDFLAHPSEPVTLGDTS